MNNKVLSAFATGQLPGLDHIRVMVLFGAIPLHGQERGNIEVYRSAGELGLKAKFITHKRWGHQMIQPELTRLGLEWTTAPFGPLMGKNLFGPDVFRAIYGLIVTNLRLWREARKWRPTHLHIMNWLYVVYATPVIFILGLPVIYRLGDCPPRSTLLHRWLWRAICLRTTVMVCNSEFVRGKLNESGGRPRRVQVIHNRPPQRIVKKKCNSLRSPGKAFSIIYIGQLSVKKGVPILIDAVRRCILEHHDVILRLLGNHSWKNPMVQSQIASLKAEGLERRIQFLGYQQDVSAAFRASDLHVCPSIWGEPFANVVLEAKAESVPSVVFPDGGLPEMIEHEVDGFICGGKTVDALVEGISWFMNQPDKAKHAGEAARRSLDLKFGEERFKRQWAEVFLDSFQGALSNRHS